MFFNNKKIATNNGYKNIKNIDINKDLALSLNLDTKKLEYSVIKEKIRFLYTNDIYEFCNTLKHLGVLPEQNVLIVNSKGKFGLKKSKDILKSDKMPLLDFLPLESNKVEYNNLNLPEIPTFSLNGINDETLSNWLEMEGFWLADGSLNRVSKKQVILTQNEENEDYVLNVLKGIGFETDYRKNKSNANAYNYRIFSKQLHEYLSKYGKSHEKFFPEYSYDLPVRFIKKLLYGYTKGDCHFKNDGGRIYCSVSLKLMQGLQMLLLLTSGMLCTISGAYSYNDQNPYYVLSFHNGRKRNTKTAYNTPKIVRINDYIEGIVLEKNNVLFEYNKGTLSPVGDWSNIIDSIEDGNE